MKSRRMDTIRADIQNAGGGLFSWARNVYVGTTSGGAVTSIVGAILGSVIPGVGTVIGCTVGTCLGGIWGAYRMVKDKQDQELRSARNRINSVLTATLSDMYSNMVSTFDRVKANIKYEVQDKLEEALGQRTHDLQAAVEELRERSKMSSDMLAKRKQELEAVKQQITAIRRVIAEYLPQPQKAASHEL